MTANQKERRIAELMKSLDCTREEAIDIIQEDEAIDSGKRVYFDLSPEEEKRAKKYANVNTHKRKSDVHRERKPNELKEAIVAEIATLIAEKAQFQPENVEITNKNRMIAFAVGEKRFELTLVEKRSPKK